MSWIYPTHNSCIPQSEQYERVLFCLGNVTYLLDVTPSNPLPHPLSPPPAPYHFGFKVLVAKQHPASGDHELCLGTESTTSCQSLKNNTHLLPQKQGEVENII